MRLLVTGGCGFIGSNFIRFALQHYGPAFITNVDALTYAGNPANLTGVAEQFGERYEFVSERLAIDLLFGSDGPRKMIEAGASAEEVAESFAAYEAEFRERRKEALLY